MDKNVKEPSECQSIKEIRDAIDKLDEQIISLFAERNRYVEEIVRFKTDKKGIIAPERKNRVINNAGELAQQKGLNGELFKEIYTLLIQKNIEHELEILESRKKQK